MKKLSFIMAVLMIMMCMPMMFVSAADEAAEEVDPIASMDIVLTNGKDYSFVGPYEKGLANDAAAVAAGYYWRIGAEGTKATYFKYLQDASAVALKKGNSNVVYMISGYIAASQTGNDVGRAPGMKIEQDLIVDGCGNTLDCAFGGKWTVRFEAVESDLKMNHTFTIKNMTINCSKSDSFFQVRGQIKFENVTYTSYTTNGLGAFVMQSPTVIDIIASDFSTLASSGGNTNGAIFRFNELVAGRGDSVVNIHNSDFHVMNSTVMCQANGAANAKAVVNVYGGSITATTAGRDMFAFTKKYYELNVYGGALTTNGMLVNANSGGANFGVNIYGGTITTGAKKDAIAGGVPGSKVTVSGGTLITDGGRITTLSGKNTDGSSYNQVVSISGGNFITKNFNTSYTEFSSTPSPTTGMIRVSNKPQEVSISGGNFSLYADNGTTLADKGAILYGWSDGAEAIKVTGGSFNGGEAFLVKGFYTGDKENPLDMEKSSIYTHTEGTNSTSFTPVVKQGAAIRLNAVSGLRFTSTMSSAAVGFMQNEMIKEGTTISYGTMIVPSNYIKYAGGELTMAALDKAGKAYVDVVAKDGLVEDENGDLVINASLVNIKKENYKRDFVAVAYVKYTDNTGAEVIKYAQNVDLANYSRNVAEIAYAALGDVHANASGAYTNEVSEYYVWNANARTYEVVNAKAYTRYSDDQLAIIKAYIAE